MSPKMCSVASAHVQIFSSVVVLDQIDMVDVFGVIQRSPQSLCHDFSVLIQALSPAITLDDMSSCPTRGRPSGKPDGHTQLSGSDLDCISRASKIADKIGQADGSSEAA